MPPAPPVPLELLLLVPVLLVLLLLELVVSEPPELLEAPGVPVVPLGQGFSFSSVHPDEPRTTLPTRRDRKMNFCMATPRTGTLEFVCR